MLGAVRFIVLAASVGFLIWLLARADLQLPARTSSLIVPAALMLVLLFGSVTLLAFLWVALLRHLHRGDAPAPWAPLIRAFARSWLARYLPGAAWAYGARFIYTDSSSIPRRVLALSMVDEFLLVTGTAAALGFSAFVWSSVGVVAGLSVLILTIVTLSSLIAWTTPVTRSLLGWLAKRISRSRDPLNQSTTGHRLSYPATLGFATGYLATNAGVAGAFAIGVVALTPAKSVDGAQLIAAYSLASLIGMVVIFAPAGIGVREAALLGLLSTSVGANNVAVSAVAVRLGLAVADIALFAFGEVWALFPGERNRSVTRPAAHGMKRPLPTSRLGSLYRAELLRRAGFADVRGRVIDIGGFDGYFASELPGEQAVVADIAPQAAFDGPSYVRADARRLPFPDRSFDYAFALDLIEHLDSEREAILEALRILRPGGVLILSTPDVGIRFFPRFLQPFIDRRWGHHRVRGYGSEELSTFFDSTLAAEVRITPLRAGALRRFYLPLRGLWRLTGPLGRWLVVQASIWDSRHLEGTGGYLLVRAVRAPEHSEPTRTVSGGTASGKRGVHPGEG